MSFNRYNGESRMLLRRYIDAVYGWALMAGAIRYQIQRYNKTRLLGRGRVYLW